jgi:leishmanolysin-like peptidase
MLVLLITLLAAPIAVAHSCVHDKISHNITKVRAPATDGAPRRVEVANAAPIRIVPLYRASNGGIDISTEAGMTPARKAVVEAAMADALARFSTLLRVTPVSGNLFAFRKCTSMWTNGNCAEVSTAPMMCFTVPLNDLLGLQTYYPSNYNTPTTLPSTGAGIANADTAIFVTAQTTSDCSGGTLAYASHCQRASNDRPTFGLINFCPASIPTSATDVSFPVFLSTVLHELTHVLVFSSSLFPYFRDDAGMPRTPRNKWGDPSDEYKRLFVCGGSYVASSATISYANERGMDCSWGVATSWATANIPYGINGKAPSDCVARLSSPRVAAAARAFFGCSSLSGADLENHDTSTCFVQGSHWDER